MKARVEIFYFGCCPWSYFLGYGGGFLDQTWTRTGGDFKAQLEKCGVEVVEYNMLEYPDLVEKYAKTMDPYNPFSNHARFLIDGQEVAKEEFFQKIRSKCEGEKSSGN